MMQVSRWKSWISLGLGMLGIAALRSATAAPPRWQAVPAAVQEVTLELDPAQSKVHYTVDSTLHTVHGTFELKKGSVAHVDPQSGKASGEITVYVTSGESGNTSRDERMHKEILETAKFPDAIFRPRQIEGKFGTSGASDVKLRGILTLHGAEHEIVASVHTELADDHWKGTARFEVPYIQWGIKDPSNWMLKVKPVVNIQLDMAGSATNAK
jgi:polyisoprenoid-binding protein YceI